jgi:histone H3/H4
MNNKLLPLAPMEKILKKCGAERVSDKSKVALKEVIEEIADEIAVNAIKLAQHAGRKTIKSKDIKLAVKQL